MTRQLPASRLNIQGGIAGQVQDLRDLVRTVSTLESDMKRVMSLLNNIVSVLEENSGRGYRPLDFMSLENLVGKWKVYANSFSELLLMEDFHRKLWQQEADTPARFLGLAYVLFDFGRYRRAGSMYFADHALLQTLHQLVVKPWGLTTTPSRTINTTFDALKQSISSTQANWREVQGLLHIKRIEEQQDVNSSMVNAESNGIADTIDASFTWERADSSVTLHSQKPKYEVYTIFRNEDGLDSSEYVEPSFSVSSTMGITL
jgi:hypothetical protein